MLHHRLTGALAKSTQGCCLADTQLIPPPVQTPLQPLTLISILGHLLVQLPF